MRNTDNYRTELIQKATPAELQFKKILEELGVKFAFQDKCVLDYPYRRTYYIDFVIKLKGYRQFLLIEIDGGYHSTETQKAEDDKRTDDLLKNVGPLIRFTNDEVLQKPETIKNEILRSMEMGVNHYKQIEKQSRSYYDWVALLFWLFLLFLAFAFLLK